MQVDTLILMIGLSLGQFMERFNAEKRLKPVTISWIVGAVITGTALMAGADFTISPATLQSKGPCSFMEQLQESASIRNQYTARLIAAQGGTVSAGNPVEGIKYGNITLAFEGVCGQGEPTVKFWGLRTKQAIFTAGIDMLSADCLCCHDGVGALEVRSVYKNNPSDRSHLRSSNQMIGMDHPIGMEYNRYVAAGKGYKPLFGISNKMVFVDGKVGCLTCHDPLNPEKGHLVISDRNSALCYTCHDK
jgi:predicted CXXCH cytochrome family protein